MIMIRRANRMSNRSWIVLLLTVMSAVFGSIWLPELAHYFVVTPSVSGETIARFRDTLSHPGSLLDNPNIIGVVSVPLRSSSSPIALAEQVLHGDFKPGYDLRPVRFPMVADDLNARGPEAGLSLASLAVPSILLDAYTATGNAGYLEAARQDILSWSNLERHAWLPLAYLWNDHAVAARTGVLLRFLATYRRLPDLDESVLREVLVFAMRGLTFLAKDSHFTFWSNHGVMQNLALLEGAAALDFLPDSAAWADKAMARLQEQFMWYVGEDGFVLEDSPGYHRVGIALLEAAIRMAKLTGREVPRNWTEQYVRARRIDDALARPDGSLPVFGDTDGGVSSDVHRAYAGELALAPACPPLQPLVYPISGLAVIWSRLNSPSASCRMAQLVVKWSHWPGHAHQTPDEMALTLWAEGTAWLTNLGYWPYGAPGRQFTDSWQSSNAPHLQGESPIDASRLVSGAQGASGDRFALDLSRHAGSGQTVGRQVLGMAPGQWLVIDSVAGEGIVPLEVVWTYPPGVSLALLDDGQGFRAADAQGNTALMQIVGGPRLEVRQVRGQVESAPGWTVVNGMPARTAGIVVHQGDSPRYLATLMSLAPSGAAYVQGARMIEWLGPDRWKLAVSGSSGIRLVERDGSAIAFSGGVDPGSIILSPMPDSATSRASDHRRLTEALSKYPKWRDIYAYRLKLSKWLLWAALSTLCVLFVVRRVPRLSSVQWPRLAMVTGWTLLLAAVPAYLST